MSDKPSTNKDLYKQIANSIMFPEPEDIEKVAALIAERERLALLKVLKPLLPEMYPDKYGAWVRSKIVDKVTELEQLDKDKES